VAQQSVKILKNCLREYKAHNCSLSQTYNVMYITPDYIDQNDTIPTSVVHCKYGSTNNTHKLNYT